MDRPEQYSHDGDGLMSAYRALILSHSPYAYWPLHEANGVTTATDVSGNGRNSASGTAPTYGNKDYWVDPDEPVSASLSGTPNSLVVPWALTAVTNNWTVSFWCRPTQTITLQTESTSGTAITSGTNRWVLYPEHGVVTNTVGVGISVGTNGVVAGEHTASHACAPAVTAFTIPSDRMTHLALRVTAKQYAIFVNGGRDTRLTSAKTNVCMPYKLGGDGTNLSNSGFNGSVSEVAWFNSALTDAQIQAHWRTGLLMWGSSGKVSY